ncbi:MAG: hypothetical protein DHS20C19_19230 [Acidimicrobiales bacterium]|nr:MAG: hypothetical protein DHS20C19_19230 [Acidimicrobiales bacterium]
MSAVPAMIRERLRGDLATAREARRAGERERSWELLEDAHVLSQPWWGWHVRVHASMLVAGMLARDGREVWGQCLRLVVAGPGSVLGRFPAGNPGRARVPATQPMPIRDDLAELLRAAR